MSTASIIPSELEPSIVRRWIAGDSPQQIANWIAATNHERKVPVAPSRSAVGRLIDRYAKTHRHTMGKAAAIPLIRRCRALAADSLDELEDIRDQYRVCMEDAYGKEMSRDDRAQLAVRIRTIAKFEMCVRRDSKLAGIDGRNAEAVNSNAEEWLLKSDEEHRQEVLNEPLVDDDEVPSPPREDVKAVAGPAASERRAAQQPGRVGPSKPLDFKQIDPNTCGDKPAGKTLPRAKEPGRNEPCPCKSGLKWKKCHGGPNAPQIVMPKAA